MLGTGDMVIVWWALVIAIGIIFPLLYAPEALLFAKQFPAQVRYSGISFGVQIAGVLGGGLAPMIATALLAKGGGEPIYVVFYLVGMILLALVCTARMRA